MSLDDRLSKAIRDVTFNYRLGGVEATYYRTDTNDDIVGTFNLLVFPLSLCIRRLEIVAGHPRKRQSLIDVFWVESADLNLDGNVFHPRKGDAIVINLAGEARCYRVMGFTFDGEESVIIDVSEMHGSPKKLTRKESNEHENGF